jgi:hypothetical protein
MGTPAVSKPDTENSLEPDRRRAPRLITYAHGEIIFADGSVVKCIVHNISETGAKIEVHAPVPQTFDLMFNDRSRRSCKLVWRRGMRLGVTFP